MSQQRASDNVSILMRAFLLAALFGYLQPWIIAQAGSMSLNAYDLAEWASLIPAQRGTSPPLAVPLLLRLQPLILALLLSLIASGRKGMALSAAAICLLAIAQLPPFEYVYDINNLNYRQQFVLAAASLVAGLGLLLLQRPWLSTILKLALAIVGIVSAALGLSEAIALYSQFGMAAAPGAGLWIMGLCYALVLLLGLRRMLIARGTRS